MRLKQLYRNKHPHPIAGGPSVLGAWILGVVTMLLLYRDHVYPEDGDPRLFYTGISIAVVFTAAHWLQAYRTRRRLKALGYPLYYKKEGDKGIQPYVHPDDLPAKTEGWDAAQPQPGA